MTIQLSNCCKAPIDFYPKLGRPECYRCSFCDRVIGSPLTPDKVEEMVGEINLNIKKNCNATICSVCGGGGYNYDKERDCTECLASGITNWDFDFLNKQLTHTLTQYHQDMMREVVWNIGAKIEEANFAEKVAERTGDGTAVYEVQEVVRQIQTIIKSLSK